MKVDNTQTKISINVDQLPLYCPLPAHSTWNAHPKVFIPIEDSPDGVAICPYCSTRYQLVSSPKD